MDSSSSSKLNIPDVSARSFSAPAAYQARKLESAIVSQKHVSEAAASSKSLSSRAKRRLEVKLAEARLERVRRDEELRLKHLQLQSERAVLQAEAGVEEANIIADASSGCSDLSVPENIAPPLSAHDKVVEFLCSARNSERQELKLSNGETDHSRESAPLVQMQNKPSSEVYQCRLSEFSLGPMPNKLHFPPAKKASVVTHGPAVRDDGPSKPTQSNPSYTEDRGRGTGSQGELGCGLNDLARMLVRCRGSESTLDSDKFDGNPLKYYQFIRQVEDRILNVYRGTDPGHALHLLLDATKGRAHKLIASCVMLSPDRALNEALQLLHKAFGSPQVAVRAFINSVCEGGVISHSEVGLEDFYSCLINCKIVLEAAGAGRLLNAASTAERIFMRLPHNLQMGFARLALERGFDMDVVPFELFIEYVDQEHKLLCSRFGRLLKQSRHKVDAKGYKARANLIQTPADNDRNAVPRTPSNESFLPKCNYCDAVGHSVARCEIFQKQSCAARKQFVQQKCLCFNCLRKGHGVKDYPSKSRCRKCNGRHHTLIHRDDGGTTSKSSESTASVRDDLSPSVNATTSSVQSALIRKDAATRLQVIPVCVINNITGDCKDTLALLDSGADCHLMCKGLSSELGLTGKPLQAKIQLADGRVEDLNTLSAECSVRGILEEEVFTLENVRVVPRLPDLSSSIPSQKDIDQNPHLDGIKIPTIQGARNVELIIGIDSPSLHVFSEIRQDGHARLWAGRSPLGWVLHGRNGVASNLPTTACNIGSLCNVNLLMDSQVMPAFEALCPCQFDYGDRSCDPEVLLPSLDDVKAENVMKDSCKFVDGHYQMRVPWKEGCPNLPNNRTMALSRLRSLGRRLVRDNELFVKYRDKIRELISLGHAVPVSDERDEDQNKTWYIPHHCTKGKFRIVFDCAAQFGGTSLNKQILQGPDNANNLIGVLTRFRKHSVAVVGDIRAMFHSVMVDPCDRSALRFFWWEDDDMSRPPTAYQLTVHCFGLTSSPSVAGFALRKTAEENRSNSTPEAVQTAERNMYVDDLLKSVPNSDSAITHINDVVSLLKGGGFELRKFSSNCAKVLEALPSDLLAPHLSEVDLHNDELPGHKTLGIVWNPQTDEFMVKVKPFAHPLTRRGLLSLVMSIFDPLGIVAPFLLPLKLHIQRLTKMGLAWDAEIPEPDKTVCNKLINTLLNLNNIVIPRCFILTQNVEVIKGAQLHVFADASVDGIGAVCYLRIFNGNRCVVSFVMGKSRVSPLQPMSIPRLELSAAVISARLARFVNREIDLDIEKTVLWTDSTVVLSYLKNTSKRRPVFETNRIKLIREISAVEQWHWVSTDLNPADPFSRGVSPSQPCKAEKWLKGVPFLLEEEEAWPSREPPIEDVACDNANAADPITACLGTVESEYSGLKEGPLGRIITRFSDLTRAVRTAAWLLKLKGRLHDRVTGKINRNTDFIDAQEYDAALLALISLAQRQEYPGLIEALESHPYDDIASGKLGVALKEELQPLVKFCPFVKDRVMRIGGRLQRSEETYDIKHPIVLPRKSHLTAIIVNHLHQKSGHNGAPYVITALRERFYVVGQERTVKRIIKTHCMACRNRRAGPGSQIMSPLPRARVEPGNRLFFATGVDFMGPIAVKCQRNTLKRYCCIFTCLASRASHLEMAYDLTTASFLMALRRFLAVRGASTKTIYCDNATNFIGAQAELKRGLKRLRAREIVNELSPRGIQFRHSPPLASHQGGAWEAIVRLVRKAMTALTADKYYRTLRDEELLTLFKEIECIIEL